jgi:hypothetical protein
MELFLFCLKNIITLHDFQNAENKGIKIVK